ncbi:dnaJ homolog subfamily B member 1-like isoform X2 [Homalodisca vitripennis]|uniref:dnaJ homolog subfamily B member 1-like isoform X2 n=1 Tax=Homalodisca vitripennis TaxID=197043 RepID=UPI001EEA9AB3|nr:dnaJ homolog subfamily B member 1-like isoform X2 [Homalodisca vitripennis]
MLVLFQANGYTIFLQMLPIMLVVILSMMSSLFISDPVYSLTASPKFPVIRNTMNLRVPYYVKETFHNEYQGSLRRLEASVEEEYVTNLRHACYREKNYNLADKPNCILLKEIRSKYQELSGWL